MNTFSFNPIRSRLRQREECRNMTDGKDSSADSAPSTQQEELRSFLFFTVVMAPAVAVIFVSGYGFLIWVYQMFAGPPGG